MRFWIISQLITCKKKFTTKPFSPSQYTPAPAVCGCSRWSGRDWKLLLITFVPSSHQTKNIKKKNRKDNLPHILLFLNYWITEQEEGFSSFGEMKCHCLKRKKKKMISLLESGALKAGGKVRCLQGHHFIRDLLCFTHLRAEVTAGWHWGGDTLRCFTALPRSANAIFIKTSCFTESWLGKSKSQQMTQNEGDSLPCNVAWPVPAHF